MHWIDPEVDGRWDAFIDTHPKASVFHTRPWLEALRRTYGYQPLAVTTAPPGTPLDNGLLMCRVTSWLTGSRLVSLPFSDHCEPLVGDPDNLRRLVEAARARATQCCRYLEIRPRSPALRLGDDTARQTRHDLHVIDLDRPLDDLFASFHSSSIQRKIRRAHREQVLLEDGRSELMMKQFYELLLMTRRRHRVPPQPFRWFANLRECLGESLTVRVATAHGRPIASMITLCHGDTLVFKYGCSDERYHHLGGVASLFWQAIQDAKRDGYRLFDLGRTDIAHVGLARFKERLGAARTPLSYWRFPPNSVESPVRGLTLCVLERGMSVAPDRVARLVGAALYRHVG